MPNTEDYYLKFEGKDIDRRLEKIDSAILYTEQTLSKEKQKRARMNIGLDFSNQEGKLLYIDSNGNIGFLKLGEGLTISNGVLGISLGYVGEDMVLLTSEDEFLIDNKDNYLTVTNYIQSVEEVMW